MYIKFKMPLIQYSYPYLKRHLGPYSKTRIEFMQNNIVDLVKADDKIIQNIHPIEKNYIYGYPNFNFIDTFKEISIFNNNECTDWTNLLTINVGNNKVYKQISYYMNLNTKEINVIYNVLNKI